MLTHLRQYIIFFSFTIYAAYNRIQIVKLINVEEVSRITLLHINPQNK